MGKTLLISGLIAVLTAQATLAQNAQQVTLYKELGCQGPDITFLKQDVTNLEEFGWEDVAYSAKVTGAWLFYDNPEYNAEETALMEYFFGVELCVNFTDLGGKLSSVRFAGDPRDYRRNTLTIYTGVYFHGQEQHMTGSMANLYVWDQKSMIGIGTSGWTLYSEPHYAGTSICVWFPQDFGPFHIFATYNIEEGIPGLAFNSIRSVEIGCPRKRLATCGG